MPDASAPDSQLPPVLAPEPPPPALPPRFWNLANTNDGAWRYIRRAAIPSFFPSIFIGMLLHAIFGGMDDSPVNKILGDMDKGLMLFFVLVLAPVGETLVLAGFIGLLRLLKKPNWAIALASTFAWALLHIPNGTMVPLVIAWPFFVFSTAYIAWRPHGWWKAIGVTSAIHFLQNLFPSLVILAS